MESKRSSVSCLIALASVLVAFGSTVGLFSLIVWSPNRVDWPVATTTTQEPTTTTVVWATNATEPAATTAAGSEATTVAGTDVTDVAGTDVTDVATDPSDVTIDTTAATAEDFALVIELDDPIDESIHLNTMSKPQGTSRKAKLFLLIEYP